MTRLYGWALAAALAAPSGVSAQGCAEFSISRADLHLNYDPFAAARVDRVFNLRVRRIDERATAVRILFADPDPVDALPVIGLGGPARYEIDWTRDAGRQVFAIGGEQPNATNGALLALGRASDAPVRNEAFRIRVPAGQDVAAGDYFQPLDIRYQCYAGDDPLGPPAMQTGGQVALEMRVPETVRTFVGSPGVRRATLDFGSLLPGGGNVSRSLSLTTQSTVPYEIEVRAEQGSLVRQRSADPGIPYSMWLSEVPVADGSRLACGRTPAPTGRQHPFRAEVDASSAATVAAGTYRDVVTLTFSPRLGLGGGAECASAAP